LDGWGRTQQKNKEPELSWLKLIWMSQGVLGLELKENTVRGVTLVKTHRLEELLTVAPVCEASRLPAWVVLRELHGVISLPLILKRPDLPVPHGVTFQHPIHRQPDLPAHRGVTSLLRILRRLVLRVQGGEISLLLMRKLPDLPVHLLTISTLLMTRLEVLQV
jgi:hypothetical protein